MTMAERLCKEHKAVIGCGLWTNARGLKSETQAQALADALTRASYQVLRVVWEKDNTWMVVFR